MVGPTRTRPLVQASSRVQQAARDDETEAKTLGWFGLETNNKQTKRRDQPNSSLLTIIILLLLLSYLYHISTAFNKLTQHLDLFTTYSLIQYIYIFIYTTFSTLSSCFITFYISISHRIFHYL